MYLLDKSADAKILPSPLLSPPAHIPTLFLPGLWHTLTLQGCSPHSPSGSTPSTKPPAHVKALTSSSRLMTPLSGALPMLLDRWCNMAGCPSLWTPSSSWLCSDSPLLDSLCECSFHPALALTIPHQVLCQNMPCLLTEQQGDQCAFNGMSEGHQDCMNAWWRTDCIKAYRAILKTLALF